MKFKEYVLKKKEAEKKKPDPKMPIMFAGISAKNRLPLKESEDDDIPDKVLKPLHDELVKHYKFEPTHGAAIHEYTKGSRRINNHLYEMEKKSLGMPHDKNSVSDTYKKSVDHTLSKLKEALSVHKAKKDMHVFSGVPIDPRKYFDKSGSHTTVRMPAFTSTSLKQSIAENFTTNTSHNLKKGTMKKSEYHVLRIKVPKGSHGAYVEHHSFFNNEHEFILHPGSHIKIAHKPYHTDSNAYANHHYYDAELVHDGVGK